MKTLNNLFSLVANIFRANKIDHDEWRKNPQVGDIFYIKKLYNIGRIYLVVTAYEPGDAWVTAKNAKYVSEDWKYALSGAFFYKRKTEEQNG